uniref:Crossover junction endonuclease MUS81 n=1 Tax=Bos mutus grunniens TaxID=30521 RepID=A0A8B9Y7H9_BOSMU
MAAPVRLGRKRPLPVCPNPLFVRWLTEWRDEAASRGRRTQFVFQKALRSLRRYPLPLRSGKEAKILQHFGDGLCRMLDQRLQQHKASVGDHAPCSPSGTKSPAGKGHLLKSGPFHVPTQLKAGGPGSYWPARHSGARAVLLQLYREHLNPSGQGFLTKEELLQRCAPKVPRVSTCSPWPALRSLLHRNLVLRTHQPARYSLTPQGLELAQKLADSEGLGLLNVGSGPEEPVGRSLKCQKWLPLSCEEEGMRGGEGAGGVPEMRLRPHLPPYRVLLCVDAGRPRGEAGHRPELLRELRRLHVAHTVRKLHAGTSCGWPKRPVPETQVRGVDRQAEARAKRLDDLCSSIIDGRPGAEGFRLKRCGLGRVYLVEEHGSAQPQPPEHTAVIDGFFVKRTADIKESAAYLALLTRSLFPQGHTLRSRPWGTSGDPESKARPSPNPLCSLLTFSDFNAGAMKNKAQSVRGVFKAAALVARYSSPAR